MFSTCSQHMYPDYIQHQGLGAVLHNNEMFFGIRPHYTTTMNFKGPHGHDQMVSFLYQDALKGLYCISLQLLIVCKSSVSENCAPLCWDQMTDSKNIPFLKKL